MFYFLTLFNVLFVLIVIKKSWMHGWVSFFFSLILLQITWVDISNLILFSCKSIVSLIISSLPLFLFLILIFLLEVSWKPGPSQCSYFSLFFRACVLCLSIFWVFQVYLKITSLIFFICVHFVIHIVSFLKISATLSKICYS